MTITKKQEEHYHRTLKQTREQIKSIEEEMAKELEGARQRLRELLEEKKATRKIYDGIASLLGVENEFEEEDKKAEKIQESNLDIAKTNEKKT